MAASSPHQIHLLVWCQCCTCRWQWQRLLRDQETAGRHDMIASATTLTVWGRTTKFAWVRCDSKPGLPTPMMRVRVASPSLHACTHNPSNAWPPSTTTVSESGGVANNQRKTHCVIGGPKKQNNSPLRARAHTQMKIGWKLPSCDAGCRLLRSTCAAVQGAQ